VYGGRGGCCQRRDENRGCDENPAKRFDIQEKGTEYHTLRDAIEDGGCGRSI